jgi:hypothetical protein
MPLRIPLVLGSSPRKPTNFGLLAQLDRAEVKIFNK